MQNELFDNLKDVFELATGATAFINEISKLKKTNKKQDEDNAIITSSGYSARIGSSGYSARIGSSGDSAQIGSSGDSARIGSSGDSARIDSTGSNAVIAAIGINTIAKAKKGSWLTLAEYNSDNIVQFVKTEYVDGEIIKEDVFYTLYNKKFYIVEVIDDISTIILKRHKNIIKGITLYYKKPCWVFEKLLTVMLNNIEILKQMKSKI